jgi:hypothetical protein
MDLPASLQLALNLIRAGEGLLLVSGLVLADRDERDGAQRMAADYHAAAEEITAHLATLTKPPVFEKPAEKPTEYLPYAVAERDKTTSYGARSFHFSRKGAICSPEYSSKYYARVVRTGFLDGWAVYLGESETDKDGESETDKDGERKMVDGYSCNCDLVCNYSTGKSRLFVLYESYPQVDKRKPIPFTSAGTTAFYFKRDGDKTVRYDGETHYAHFDPDSRQWKVRILNASGAIQNSFHESWVLHCEYPFGKTEFEAPKPSAPPAAVAEEKKKQEEKKPEIDYN